MMNIHKTMSVCFLILLAGCNPSSSQRALPDEVYDRLAISNRDKLSAASKRAIERNYDQGPQWYCQFKVHDLKGDFKYDETVTRRDPSAVITVDGIYQTVKAPYANRVKNQVGMAIADFPQGPFKKLNAPILSPADNGEWSGEEDTRFKVRKQGDFDSHKVHDPTLLYYRGKFYLYYKGERMGERKTFGGREIKWGVAIADKPTGPYTKSEYNPITNSGHELCVWPYNGGIGALIITDGPERNTIQWSPDGINFEIKSHIKYGPPAAGLDRSTDTDKGPLAALKWGLTHKYVSYDRQYIRRFEIDMPFSP